MKKVRVEFNLSVSDDTKHKKIADLVKKGVLLIFEEDDQAMPSITSLQVDDIQVVKKVVKKKKK